ncbi:amino acid--ACP ligase [Cohnella sp. GCM10027633]|uniref:amino acid--ACP ligase n=1 Tax=unclassified Cohnella TaxID=2636738 RepID=UPI0036308831
MTIRLSYKDKLSRNQAESLAGKLVYSIEGIRRCGMDEAAEEIYAEPIEESRSGEIAETIAAMLEEERGIRTLGSRTVRDYSRPAQGGERRLLVHDGHREDTSPVDVGVKKDSAVELVRLLDGLFLRYAVRRKAAQRQYPSMIALGTLEKCGYVRSFPQNLFTVSEFPHRYRTLRQVKEAADPTSLTRPSRYALSPAVCFHCYEELAGTALAGPTLLTASGACFRHEAPWRVGGHRLNEFGMREVVFVGEAGFVEEERNWWMEEIGALFRELGLKGIMATANDPFYFSEDAMKSQHQKMANMKYELIVEDRRGNSYSIASFNNMSDSLCKPFSVVAPSGAAHHSGCVAFGIDRWAYALLTEYGTLDEWPAGVRDVLEGKARMLAE